MPVTGKFFPGQRVEEEVFLLLRRHWFTYIVFLILTLVMAIPLIVLVVYWSMNPDSFAGLVGDISLVVGSAYTLAVLALLLYGFIDYYLDVYIVTNERIVDIKQNGFFKREIAELHLRQVQDVSANVTGFFPTIMHYGDIIIQTAAERENFYFKSIPHPYRVSKKIADLHETQFVRQRGSRINGAEESERMTLKGLSDIDLRTFSEARKRTKDFLKDSSDEVDIAPPIEEEEPKKVLKGLKEDEDKARDEQSDIVLKDYGKDSDIFADNKPGSNKQGSLSESKKSKKQTKEEPPKSSTEEASGKVLEEGELEENKEVDI